MRLIPKLYISFGSLLAIALISVAMAIWSAREAEMQLERTHLAHQVYEAYLELSSNTYQLFKQFGDAMLIGDRDQGAGEKELIDKIRANIATIRQVTGLEIEMVGEEEIEELDRLSKVEKQIQSLLNEYANLVAEGDVAVPTNWIRLSHVLDEEVDRRFNALIQEALDDEASEVQETRDEAAERVWQFKLMAGVFGLIAILAAAASLALLVRDIRRPIEKLLTGARALAGGDLDHRVETQGISELEDVGRAFNRMADEIATREQALSQSNEDLEQAVADRTEELERVLKQLKTNEENRKRLLADVSHELRTPLTVIRGEADVALRGDHKPPEVYREALQRAREAAMHTAALVDDLLFVARQESGETRLNLEQVDLASLLPAVIEQHGVAAERHKAMVSFRNGTGPASVRCDPGRIRQVVLILLENAFHYGGSNIDLHLDQGTSGYVVTLCDDGPGMTDDEMAHAFERFFRGSNAAVRYDQGAGLGLPMAKAIVEAHGGEIALKSAPGEGLTVSFTLPTRAKLALVS